MKQLICLGAQACGVGALEDIAGYLDVDGWRDRLAAGPWWAQPRPGRPKRTKSIARRLIRELVEESRLLPTRVEGWALPAYLHPEARVPRTVEAAALVAPFDSLVWQRRRIARLFGMTYSVEIYVPEPKRVYGYYVCPFLLDDRLVARCDLKADRARRVLSVRGAFIEPGVQPRGVAPRLIDALDEMRQWLELDRIEIGPRGNLAEELRRAARPR
jgi:hypothetical protein